MSENTEKKIIKIKRKDIEMMTELVNVSRDVAKLIKNKQLKEDDDRFIYLYSEWHEWHPLKLL